MNPDEEDQLAVILAGIDQYVALAPELARSASGLFDAFLARSFTESQALYLTAAHMLQNPGKAP